MITEATVQDLPGLLNLCRAFHKEGNLPGEFIDTEFLASWTTMVSSKVGHIFVSRSESGVTGMLGCLVYNDLNDGKKVAMEAFWYVLKEFRGQGVRLLKHFESWAKSNGVVRIAMACLAELNAEHMKSIYSRMGYRPMDMTFIKEVA